MADFQPITRRGFIGGTAAALAATQVAMGEEPPKVATTTPQPSTPQDSSKDSEKGMPYGMLGKTKLSRMFLGGNLVGGFMHCRDLKYVTDLFRAYVTEAKIMETFKLAEEQGINVVLETGEEYVRRYNKEFGGHMSIIPSLHPDANQNDAVIKDEIKRKVDAGVPAMYVWGVRSDELVNAGRVDVIAKAVEFAKVHGLPVGVGGHDLRVVQACEKAKVPCDFYVKTFHSIDYPSATLNCDSSWCSNPTETAEFMQTVTKPWVAFKVLAAGAIYPRQGFANAFRNGADFIAVGMFDFQVKDNCDLARRLIDREKTRPRPWQA
jgi:hypothetical protein